MHPDDLRRLMAWLQRRVTLADPATTTVVFAEPSAAEMAAAGLPGEAITKVRHALWWEEMIADVLDTPNLCDPGDPPEQVLGYARDVVAEYIRKRVRLE